MASPVFEIRFKNTEQFNIENQSEFKLLPKEKFEKFELSLKNHKIYVLNPNSKILIASFVGEHLKYGYDQNEKILKLLQTTKTNSSEQFNVIMEFKIEEEKDIKPLIDLVTRGNKTIKFRDPLAFTPSRKDMPSILSAESPRQNFRGFINLAIIILIITNFRLILENFLKYGFLLKIINPLEYSPNIKDHPCVLASIGLNGFALMAFQIQKLGFSNEKYRKRVS